MGRIMKDMYYVVVLTHHYSSHFEGKHMIPFKKKYFIAYLAFTFSLWVKEFPSKTFLTQVFYLSIITIKLKYLEFIPMGAEKS